MKPGDKVICVDGQFEDWVYGIYWMLPVEGAKYVIRSMTGGVTYEGGRHGSVVVYLVGVNNPISEASGQEFGFQERRFRLLSEMEAEAIETSVARN